MRKGLCFILTALLFCSCSEAPQSNPVQPEQYQALISMEEAKSKADAAMIYAMGRSDRTVEGIEPITARPRPLYLVLPMVYAFAETAVVQDVETGGLTEPLPELEDELSPEEIRKNIEAAVERAVNGNAGGETTVATSEYSVNETSGNNGTGSVSTEELPASPVAESHEVNIEVYIESKKASGELSTSIVQISPTEWGVYYSDLTYDFNGDAYVNVYGEYETVHLEPDQLPVSHILEDAAYDMEMTFYALFDDGYFIAEYGTKNLPTDFTGVFTAPRSIRVILKFEESKLKQAEAVWLS